MKREDKYPNTSVFTYYNANPKNKITTDCVIRAISTATNKPYNEVVMEIAELQCKTGIDMDSKQGIEKYLATLGWIKHKQPRKYDNTKYTGKEFCKYVQEHPFIPFRYIIANIGGHHIVAIIDGKILDTWNSSDGSIGNYWTKC